MSAPKAAETDSRAEEVASLTGVTAESLQKKLEDGIQAQHVDIEDMSGERKCLSCSALLTSGM